MNLPYSEACERNKRPILEVLKRELPAQGTILEIGSCTGQHIVFFAAHFPTLNWQPSDQVEYHEGLKARLTKEDLTNVQPVMELDVTSVWPTMKIDAAYSANTAHIMGWDAVCAMFEGLSKLLKRDSVFCLYGPFNRDGRYSSPSNEAFDLHLRGRDPRMGIRNIEDLVSLAGRLHMKLEREEAMPANNQLLVFRRYDESGE